jgi:hypothetical protein
MPYFRVEGPMSVMRKYLHFVGTASELPETGKPHAAYRNDVE